MHELDTALAEVREEAELLQLRLRIARAERDALRAADRRAAAAPDAAACDPVPAHHAAQVILTLQLTDVLRIQADRRRWQLVCMRLCAETSAEV